MDTHLDRQGHSTALLGEPTLPDALLCHTQVAAVNFLERSVRDMAPLTALAGDAGTGKTTALNAALARRDGAGDRIIRAHDFVAGPLSLHRALTSALGVGDAGELSIDRLEPALRRALAGAGHATPPVLAVDNAQSLLPETLRYLALLAGLREAGRPLFRVLLVGRSGFTARQPMPVQFTLEPIQPHAALRVVERRLANAGVALDDDTVQGIVHDARGNLRRLNTLLRERIEEPQVSGRKRLRSTGSLLVARARRLLPAGQPRWRDTLAAASALLGISVTCGFIAYRSETPRASDKQLAKVALLGTPRAQAASPAGPALSQPTPPTLPTLPALSDSNPVKPQPSPPAAAVPTPTPVAATFALPAENDRPMPVTRPAALPTVLPTAFAPPLAGHFRVNNISSCHRGVCPRWSVTDIDRQTHFIAAFDPTPLHLDHDTMQRLRQGTLELAVSGSVRRRGQEGQMLVADALQSIAPHRGRPRTSADANDSAPPEERSPPPGFLIAPVAASTTPLTSRPPGQSNDPEQ